MPSGDRQDTIVDYDSGGYDYRGFWRDRDYERWAESRVISRLIAGLGRPDWFVDLGGGFGRNAEHYLGRVGRAVIADYSVTNLERAGEMLAADIAAGRLFLVRADVNRLPFADGAFDAGMVVRVLHHLTDVRGALAEMSRILVDKWIVDVPIKHHLLGRLRATVRGDRQSMRSPDPSVTGDTQYPFYNYRLQVIRERLEELGWRPTLVASVNNFRNWDRRLPRPAATALRPVVYGGERLAQTVGRGWWGPSQFLMARRETPIAPAAVTPEGAAAGGTPDASAASVDAELAGRLQCPKCGGPLTWSADVAHCAACDISFPRTGAFWDFVPPA